jgi:AraC family transcriptional regulator
MRSAIRFLDARGRPLDALAGTDMRITSQGLGWTGLSVEAGYNEHWIADELVPDAHYLAWNVGEQPLTWEAKVDGRFRRVTNAPGELWFCPAGESFSHIVANPSHFLLVTIEQERLDRWTGGRRLALDRRYGLASTQLDHLARALAAEAERGNPNGTLFVDALGGALAQGVAGLFGDAPLPVPGALAASRLARVLDYIDAHLGDALTIELLATQASYSPTHFARAFKAATRQAPHRYVMQRRLERAQELIRRNVPLAEVATSLGFTDQSHFTKAFASAFGATPARWSRQRLGHGMEDR